MLYHNLILPSRWQLQPSIGQMDKELFRSYEWGFGHLEHQISSTQRVWDSADRVMKPLENVEEVSSPHTNRSGNHKLI